MTDAQVDNLLRDLATELSIEPSSQMVARVRERISDRSKSSQLAAWTVGLAVTLVVTVIAFSIEPGTRRTTRSIAPAPAPQVRAVEHVAVSPPVSAVPSSPADSTGMSVPRRTAHARSALTAVEATAEVLVPPDQAIALRRILLAMRTGRSPVPPALAEMVDAEGRLPAPDEIGIPAIVIQPIAPPTDGGRSKDR
jgi:hypothetical protein